jgi:hypothetical protein
LDHGLLLSNADFQAIIAQQRSEAGDSAQGICACFVCRRRGR